MEQIILEDIQISVHIGCCDAERNYPQLLKVTLFLNVDFTQPSQTDSLNDAVDYYQLSKLIIQKIEGQSFNLMERLGDEIMNICIHFKGVKSVELLLKKHPALMPKVGCVTLRMHK